VTAQRVERRLAAILAGDVAGYSRLVGADEEGTLAALTALRRDLAYPKIAEYHGRIVRTTGDGLLVEFASVVDAVRCAAEVQREMALRNDSVPMEQRIEFRIGINIGDIINDGDDIFGEGVNIAARLEALAEPGGICVSRVVRDQVRNKLPIAFEDRGEQRVKNIARPVRIYRVLLDAEARTVVSSSPEPATSSQPPLPDRPSIAVLPFQNMSGDPEQEYFADGMVEEIITALSRIRWLFVIARNSTFTYKGQAIDIKRVGRELGVRYVLEGSVRKAGDRVRITAQLIEALNGAHLWADRFDGSLEDIFDLQDKVASSVAGVIDPALQAAETIRSAERPTHDLTAYDLYLRAYEIGLSSGKDLPEALRLLDQAIDRDPRYAPALALAAVGHLRLCVDGLSKDSPAHRRRGADLAHRALKVARDDPSTLANASLALAYFGEDIGAMADRSRAGAQPELCARLVCERDLAVVCGSGRHCDRACRSVDKAQPGGADRHGRQHDWSGAFSQPALRRGLAEAAACDLRKPGLPRLLPLSRRVLCSYGPARGSTGNRGATARHHTARSLQRRLSARR
jgi:TolB-like protein/class 3 adenylate cyclase